MFYQRWQWWAVCGVAMLDTLIPFIPIVAWGLVILTAMGPSAIGSVLRMLTEASGEGA